MDIKLSEEIIKRLYSVYNEKYKDHNELNGWKWMVSGQQKLGFNEAILALINILEDIKKETDENKTY